jgi:hypothetical protein
MYDGDFFYHIFLVDFIISCLQWVEGSENTNFCIKFLLQFQKQWENSAMLLASNKQHKEITKNKNTIA